MDFVDPMAIFLTDHQELVKNASILRSNIEAVLDLVPVRQSSPMAQQLNGILELVSDIQDKIYSHFYKEEQVLFQIIEENFSDRSCTVVMRNEHGEILERCFRLLQAVREVIDNLSDLERVSKLEPSFFEFLNALESHLRREEQVLYPMVWVNLSEEQMLEIHRRVITIL